MSPPTADDTVDDPVRRDFLYIATGALGATAVAAVVWPFIDSLNPAADVSALAEVEIDISDIEVGERVTVMWQSKPVFIDHRTPDQIDAARLEDVDSLPDPQSDEVRVQRPEWLIVVGVCTHLGCIPLGQRQGDPLGNWGGWFCPCHGSHYDTSGRIRRGPAPTNLIVPPYTFQSDTTVIIG
ncbi:ubiquinol-cytochrome c reductase iron-sulfur subunit [Acuticoccus sp. MNP-M23]|uniref:ubiquinol-cytochrome c reductase iron-sulfur subunit n=1 Tax=Acuticoccus sp. MNP-M23 TaxID=3072793 RepID=UPI0028153C0D|nr:ubiquinol-cytochrome c reductase iron-sulfur subunit [Acuticoccus sp. MNP-M23]WMS44413.1 ubiquinol-cytochrome c reductase iron-sulfur subunit [Acuticoccus sp. MNP-M23]